MAAWVVWPEHPAVRFEGPHCVVRRLQRADRREHVNDRLRGQAGNRCRADVLNRARQLRAKHGGHRAPLAGELARPPRVVIDDLHELIGHPPNLQALPTRTIGPQLLRGPIREARLDKCRETSNAGRGRLARRNRGP